MRPEEYLSPPHPDEATIFRRDEKFSFRMNFRGNEDPSRFLARKHGDVVIAERQRILDADPEFHIGILEEGEPLLDSLLDYLEQIDVLDAAVLNSVRNQRTAYERCLALARNWEPDFALMEGQDQDEFRLVGGCVCFPSSWSPEQKMGKSLAEIHTVVPTLQEKLGINIGALLSSIKPGMTMMRSDWGLKCRPDWNHHPRLGLPLPDASTTIDESFIRVERQQIVGLDVPHSTHANPAFLIRVHMHSMRDYLESPLGPGFLQTLETMPEDVADYKGIKEARMPLVKKIQDYYEAKSA